MCGSFSSTEGISLNKPFLPGVLSAFAAPTVAPLSHRWVLGSFGNCVSFFLLCDRAEAPRLPWLFRGETGCTERFEAGLSPGDRCCVEEGERRNLPFWQLRERHPLLSCPATKLIEPLQLVAQCCVPWSTRRSGPAHPERRNKSKTPEKRSSLPKREADSCSLCQH